METVAVNPASLAVTVPATLLAVKISEPVTAERSDGQPLPVVFVALLTLLMLLELVTDPPLPSVPAVLTLMASDVKSWAGP